MIEIRVADAGRGAGWLLDGFKYFTNSAGAWIGIIILVIIFFILSTLIPVIGSLVYQLLAPVFGAGLLLGCREIDNGGKLTINHLFVGFSNNFGQLVLIGVFQLVGMFAIIILAIIFAMVMLGGTAFLQSVQGGDIQAINENARSILLMTLVFMLFYLPLIMAMWFAPALVVLENQKVMSALISSFKGCAMNIVPFLIYGLVGLVLCIVASIPLMLGWFVLLPMTVASIYIAYKDIFYTVPIEYQDVT